MTHRLPQTRRRFLASTMATTGMAFATGDWTPASGQQLAPTPACGDEPTIRQTEGPF